MTTLNVTDLNGRTATRALESRTGMASTPVKDVGVTSTPLAEAVQNAVRSIHRQTLHPVAAATAGIAFQPRVIVGLLSYYYASDVFSSADIEDAMRRDGEFRRLCTGEFPDAQMLRRFRRQNREAVEHCLCVVLRQLADQRGERLTEVEIIADAHQRITTAILMDMNEN